MVSTMNYEHHEGYGEAACIKGSLFSVIPCACAHLRRKERCKNAFSLVAFLSSIPFLSFF